MADFFSMHALCFRGAVFGFIAQGVEHDTRHPGYLLLSLAPPVCLLQALEGLPFFFFCLSQDLLLAIQFLAHRPMFYVLLGGIEAIMLAVGLDALLAQFTHSVHLMEQLPVMADR